MQGRRQRMLRHDNELTQLPLPQSMTWLPGSAAADVVVAPVPAVRCFLCKKIPHIAGIRHPSLPSPLKEHYDACLQGIKVVDADSKQKALQALKAEQAMRQMEVDGEPAAAGLKKAKKKVKTVKIKRKGARSEDGSSSRSRQKPAPAAAVGGGDGPAAMQLA
jgi:hypothetical protein